MSCARCPPLPLRVRRADTRPLALATGHFDNAVDEYASALTILGAILPPYNRSLSELHMLIALALDFVPDSVDRAVSHAEKAKAVLLLKLAQLEGIKDKDKTEKDTKEIADIKELMGDVDMKVRPRGEREQAPSCVSCG